MRSQSNKSFSGSIQSEHSLGSTLHDSFVEEAYSSKEPLWKQSLGHRVHLLYHQLLPTITINPWAGDPWKFFLMALKKVQYWRRWDHNFTFNNVAQYITEAHQSGLDQMWHSYSFGRSNSETNLVIRQPVVLLTTVAVFPLTYFYAHFEVLH